jgi:hypothetical protein
MYREMGFEILRTIELRPDPVDLAVDAHRLPVVARLVVPELVPLDAHLGEGSRRNVGFTTCEIYANFEFTSCLVLF